MLIWEARETFQSQDVRRWQRLAGRGGTGAPRRFAEPSLPHPNPKEDDETVKLVALPSPSVRDKLPNLSRTRHFFKIPLLIWRDVWLTGSPGTGIQEMLSEIFFLIIILFWLLFANNIKIVSCMPPVYFTVPHPRAGRREALAYVTPRLGVPSTLAPPREPPLRSLDV